MSGTIVHTVGTIKLGAESYRLVRTDHRRAWEQPFVDEPPWTEGAPPMLSEPQQTWHMGGLKSQQGLPGTSEYGQNTETRFPFRLLPGPKVNTVTLTGSITPPTYIFEGLGYVFILAGRYVYAVAPADDSVVQVKDFGAGVNAVMGLEWDDGSGIGVVYITTDTAVADADSLWKVTSGVFDSVVFDTNVFDTGAITFEQTNDVSAYRLAAGINRLFKINKTGELSNVLAGSDPLVAANYFDEVQMGDKDIPPTGLVAYGRTVFAGTSRGLYGVDTDGYGVSLIKRVAKDDENGLGMEVYDPYVIFPHSRGAIRFIPGLVESIGLEQEIMNESIVKGRFKAFAPDQQWLYGALDVSGDTYILWAKERPSLGPLTWDTWVYLDARACKAMRVSTLNDPTRLWIGHGVNAAYIKLAMDEFTLSGSRYSVKYKFGDMGDKDFPKVVLVGKNLTSARYWEVSYAVDGGSFSNLDVDGSVMRINSNGRSTFYLPTSVVGREIQFKYDYTGDDATEAGELIFVEGFAVPRPRKIPMYAVLLQLASDIRHDEEVEARSSLEQFNDLETLLEQATAVASYGPWGDNKNVWVKGLKMIEVLQTGSQEPEFLVEALIQRREEA